MSQSEVSEKEVRLGYMTLCQFLLVDEQNGCHCFDTMSQAHSDTVTKLLLERSLQVSTALPSRIALTVGDSLPTLWRQRIYAWVYANIRGLASSAAEEQGFCMLLVLV